MKYLTDATKSPAIDADASAFGEWGNLADLVAKSVSASPYLMRLSERHGDWLIDRLDAPLDDILTSIRDDIIATSQSDLAQQLRIAKARTALVLSLADLGGVNEVLETTRYLTEFADFTIQKAMDFSIAEAQSRKKLPIPKGGHGLFAIAMGKQGAYELNYSSDCDIILLFDETRYPGEDVFSLRKGFIRVAQNMVKLLSENTADGYVFRVDLRLRPDPNVTPVVISADQALSYYEALGRTWERAAYIKARICAGDCDAGDNFLAQMRPFIWRRHLDFAAIEDAHNMRLRIREHKRLDGAINLIGHHLKLGRGGIREIEFFTQTRQLIFGGRDEGVRSRTTLGGLAALAAREIITQEIADYLTGEYLWLRHLEHATQMINDQQTHIVPDGKNLDRFFALIGTTDPSSFETEFIERLSKIDATMEKFFVATGVNPQDDVTGTFDEATQGMIDDWVALPALRTERARRIFDRVRPQILAKLAQSLDPNMALRNFDRFLRGLPAGVQIFSLFDANPALMDLLGEIAVLAPNEARLLGERPHIFEAVLTPDFFKAIEADEDEDHALRQQLAREMGKDPDYETVLNAIRRFVGEAQFRVSVHLLRDLVDPNLAGRAYSQIADIALDALYAPVMAEMTRRYGEAPGRGAAVLALGKLGSREMTRSSDLDLVMIYDASGVEFSNGKRPLAASTYYARFTQNYIQALTVATGEGAALYEVDMRLRPSGRQGPVAVSLTGFRDYQRNEAWVWEHLALSRGRVVAGAADLGADVTAAAGEALANTHPVAKIRNDLVEMRNRLRDNFADPSPLALKHGKGRALEIDLFIQGLALEHGLVSAGHSMDELLNIGRQVLSQHDGDVLVRAHQVYSELTQFARLSFAGEIPQNPPAAWLARTASVSGATTLQELETFLSAQARAVTEIFDRYYEVKS